MKTRKEKLAFTIATKIIKYLGINLPKDTKSIHINHLHFYILTMKNQKEELKKQSHSPLQQKELDF